MTKQYNLGAVNITINETDVKWQGGGQLGSIPILHIISINYNNGIISIIGNGFSEKITITKAFNSPKIVENIANCVNRIKQGDLSVLEPEVEVKKAKSTTGFALPSLWGWVIIILLLSVFIIIATSKITEAERLEAAKIAMQKEEREEEREKAAYDALPQSTKDSIEADRKQRIKVEEERLQQIRKNEIAEENAFLKTKAGKIWKKHKDWSREDCARIAKGEIWIGMNIWMVVYMRGKPDSANPSNYGGKTHWQWCWHDHTPSCFYDNDDDNIIESYN